MAKSDDINAATANPASHKHKRKHKRSKEEKNARKEAKKRKKEKRKHKNHFIGDEQAPAVKKAKREDKIEEESSASKPAHPSSSSNNLYKIVQSSALEHVVDKAAHKDDDITLLLFYQYVDPPWGIPDYKSALERMQQLGDQLNLTGRMRTAREGLNCTLTGTHDNIVAFCQALRKYSPRGEFAETEFKLTTDLPRNQSFPHLKVIPVSELVHYGLAKEKAPPIGYTGVHLDPKDYHEKLGQDNTVVIDVRNHYEANIGHFQPPEQGAKWIDPNWRKSTEFPIWLDKPEVKEQLKGKQVLMYCTGGVRCERASALLNYKIEKDPEIADLGIKGVYQLQGGIDKYFKEYPEGGYWQGKNYTFDKRFAHAPPKTAVEEEQAKRQKDAVAAAAVTPMGKCEACHKPWDMYRGKRRCPACGVPSLICRDCMLADKNGTRKLDRSVRCDLCVQEGIKSKAQIRQKEQQEEQKYMENMTRKGLLKFRDDEEEQTRPAPNPDGITRLALKNMCRKNMDEATLMETLPGITHIVWKTDRKTGNFFGSGWVEMATPEDAARAVGMSGKRVLGRPLYISYEAPNGKDRWPAPHSAVGQS